MRAFLLYASFYVFTLISGHAQSQYKISFSYDAAGNQTLRNRVCVNCNSSAKVADSTIVASVEDQGAPMREDSENFGESGIVIYPNPVTDILTLEWRDTRKKVAQLTLFSGIGQQLFQKSINTHQGTMGLNFSTYASGRYIVVVLYTDRSSHSFHVIKK
ncbi:T9SS type A sorting domain-containing protein [Flavobacteriaceae bacterium 3-367]